MGFQVTAPTPVPVDGDGSQNQLTWGEGGGPFAVPPEEANGYPASSTLSSNSLNYEQQHAGRWSRATVGRTVLSDEGFMSSCVVYQGAWNIGAATLDVTLTPSRVVIDYDANGGVVLEIKAPAGSPETLAPNSDSYLSLSEAGAYALTVVANGAPAPAPPANHVHIWVLVTDATELTAVNLADGIAPYPCFATVGARELTAESLHALATSGAGPTDPFPLTNGATIGASKEVKGDASTKLEAGTVIAIGQSESGTGFTGIAGSIAILSQGASISANRYLVLAASSAPTAIGQLGRDSNGNLLYHTGDHVTAPGLWASARQEANTGSAQVTTTLQTGARQDAPVTMNVTVEVYISRSVSGTVSMTIQEDNGIDGGGQVWSTLGNAFVTPTISSAFTLVRFTRTRVTDGTARYFRLRADAGVGAQQAMKEGLITVYPAGG